jgi:hypothetical protein
MLDTSGTLSARAPQGLRASLKGVACLVAFVIGISLSLPMQVANGGSIDATKSTKQMISLLANKQLTDKQYACHQEIVYRESRWDEKAIGNIGGTKQVYGLYQLKSEYIKGKHPEIQFWKYWQYVAHRYGITEYDEPMYCAALHHLKTKGWQ